MKYTSSKIRKLANNNELEVEIIIEAAFQRDEAIAKELETLKQEYNWSEDSHINGTDVVPLGKWVKFACVFIRHGYNGLVNNYQSQNDYSLSFLQGYKTTESVEAVHSIAHKFIGSATIELQHDVATAVNLLLSFKGGPSASHDTLNKLKAILHSYLSPDLDDTNKAVIYCALRGVGDQESIDIINKQTPLKEPWDTTASTVVRSIKTKIKKNA